LPTATRRYGFSAAELRARIAAGELRSRRGTFGAERGVLYVSRQGCADLRNRIGYSEIEAAARIGVSLDHARELLAGVNWRGAEHIPLITIQAAIKRKESQEGYSIAQAAKIVGKSVSWVQARIDDGSVRVLKTQWNGRLYFSTPMIERLRKAVRAIRARRRSPSEWMRQSASAALAGVSLATIVKWAKANQIRREHDASGWHYHVPSLRRRARRYWRSQRYLRAVPPAWLRAESASDR
jgi:transposase